MKRAFDLGLALVGLALSSPLILVASVAVRFSLGRPVLFRQRRPGLFGRPFTILKLRTMTNKADSTGNLLPDADRLTAVGRFLRATSLDELPELVNVVRGDMSLVGPRPLLMEYQTLYSPQQARRQEVRPGITGWAQVHGRNELTWEEHLRLDVWYVENRSLLLDMKILMMTVLAVLRMEGITSSGHPTREKFRGPDL